MILSSRAKGVVFILLAACGLSLGGLLVRHADASAWEIVFWRSVTMSLVLVAFLGHQHGWNILREVRRTGWAGFLCGCFLAATFFCFVAAVQSTTVANTVVIMSTTPFFAAVFGERFQSPASARARELVQQGAVGRLVSTTTMAPHRMNRPTRPDWFWDARTNGSILVDIGCHQIDAFLHLTGRTDAEIVHAAIRTVAPERTPVSDFQDGGEMILRNDVATGTMQMHWFTPNGLADWGDGRAFIVGTEGYIELRKNLDLAGREGGQHLFLVTNSKTEHIACAGVPVLTFRAFANDLRDRTETAMTQAHCFAVCRLALEAEETALRRR